MAGTVSPRRRWDDDSRFAGVADASAFAAAIDELAELARRPRWVAEEPEIHLLPPLRAAGETGLRLGECTIAGDGVLDVAAEHGPGDSRRDIRRRAWALIGAIAEPAASVRERSNGGAVVFEVVTGIPGDAGPFASHGHTLRLTVRPPAAGAASA